jgi:hypothetical protein
MKKAFLFSIAFVCSISAYSQSDLEKKLFEFCDVMFEKIETAKGFEASYKLMIKQPLDHNDASKGSFYQKVYLNHRNVDSTTVQITEGYNRSSNRIYELTDFVEGNQVTVEHRFFGESLPDSLMYDYLNFEQATSDLHLINQLMKQIYNGKFIASGISKGGTTTIMYRYFYPNDVTVSIPYVAPLNHELEEKRIYHFLDTVGTQECRDNTLAFQKRLLKNRDYNIEGLKWYAVGKGLKFSYLTLDKAFEYAVLEYPFSLWQWGSSCDDIPLNKATMEDDLNHLIKVSGVDFFADASMDGYASHYYQSGTEMGYYGYEIADFKGLIKSLDGPSNPSAVFMPNKMKGEWDATLTNKVAEWIEDHGNQFVYINGLYDTWSATRVPVSNKVDALWFNMAGQSHGTARIKNMSDTEKALLKTTLNKWLAD